MNSEVPKGITVNKKVGQLTINWGDGHVSVYPFALVRNACPCAECRGGHDEMKAEPPAEVFFMPEEDKPATHLVGIENVGSYAITIQWEDGHHFGIYTWHYLRALCPCPICREMMIYGK